MRPCVLSMLEPGRANSVICLPWSGTGVEVIPPPSRELPLPTSPAVALGRVGAALHLDSIAELILMVRVQVSQPLG